jgi:hypothetical protein
LTGSRLLDCLSLDEVVGIHPCTHDRDSQPIDPPRHEEGDDLPGNGPGPAQQKQKSDDVGQEAGQHQQHAAYQDQGSIGELPSRHLAPGEGGIESLPGTSPFMPHQKDPNDRLRDQDQHCRKKSELLADHD